MTEREQVDAVRVRLLPDAEVRKIAPDSPVPVAALRAHLLRRHMNVARVRADAARAHVETEALLSLAPWLDKDAVAVRVFWPDGTVDRLRDA